MPWQELHITTRKEYAEQLSCELNLLGADAVTLQDAGDDPIFEPSIDTPRIWQRTMIIGLFSIETSLTPVIDYLEQHPDMIDEIKILEVADEDWVRRSLDSFKPMQFGKRLWVSPSWQTPPVTDAVTVILDPGLAFGTGSHATTGLCLSWLDQHINQQELIIDYGTGSGILAITALKLGAKKAIAIDNDPQSLIAAEQNARRNDINHEQLTTYLPQYIPKIKADCVIANILANPLIELREQLINLLKPNGDLVLSGILTKQIDEVKNAYAHQIKWQTTETQQDWACLFGKKISK